MTRQREIQEISRDLKYITARLEGLANSCTRSEQDRIIKGIFTISIREIQDVISVLEKTKDEIDI